MNSGLAVYASRELTAAKRLHHESQESIAATYCSEYQRDCERITQSTAFRRLAYKTHIFIQHEGEAFRTALTHTLAVSRISRIIARGLHLNDDLAEAIALGHDLGQTPFGTAGRDALSEAMNYYGGFEHSVQSLRVVDELEDKYPNIRGLNLTDETREGILKDCSAKQAKNLGTVALRFRENSDPSSPSLEAQVANACDDIVSDAYNIDDALRARLVSVRQLREHSLFGEHYAVASKKFANSSQRTIIATTIRYIIAEQISNVIETSRAQLDALQPKNAEEIRVAEEPMVSFSAMMYQKHTEMQQFLTGQVYRHHQVRRMEFKTKKMIQRLFDTFNADSSLLPLEAQVEIQRLQANLGSEMGRARGVADYIASLTDKLAISEYERLFDINFLA